MVGQDGSRRMPHLANSDLRWYQNWYQADPRVLFENKPEPICIG